MKESEDSPPLCECHSELMLWGRDSRKSRGGYWLCRIKARENSRRWYEANPEKAREKSRRWREANPEEVREYNAKRLYASGMYLGMVGFTKKEREVMLNGAPQ